jgi:hypothetical protein
VYHYFADPFFVVIGLRRCFEALGFDEYLESHGDGLQILRYNITRAYNSHMDWIEDKVSKIFVLSSFLVLG